MVRVTLFPLVPVGQH